MASCLIVNVGSAELYGALAELVEFFDIFRQGSHEFEFVEFLVGRRLFWA
jgi:hypothetical protein